MLSNTLRSSVKVAFRFSLHVRLCPLAQQSSLLASQTLSHPDRAPDRTLFARFVIVRFDKTPVPKESIQNILDKVGLCPNSYGPHVWLGMDCDK